MYYLKSLHILRKRECILYLQTYSNNQRRAGVDRMLWVAMYVCLTIAKSPNKIKRAFILE